MEPVVSPTLVERAATHIRKNLRWTALRFANGSSGLPQQSVSSATGSPVVSLAKSPTPTGTLSVRPARLTRSRAIALDRARLRAAHIIDWVGARTRASEELRIVKRALLRKVFTSPGQTRAGANLVMITSARPGEGKTFTALNLALGIAIEPSHHVLLVDADTTRQGLREVLGLNQESGLLDVLSGNERELSQVILRTDIPNLALVLAGAVRDDTAELLAGSKMVALLQEMGNRYNDRIILIDAPPCTVSSDAAALASSVGQVILVIEAERTQRGEIEVALDMVKNCRDVSLILNKVPVAGSHSLGLYGSYYGGIVQ